MKLTSIEEIEECPSCKSIAIGYCETEGEGYFECFECSNEWSV